MQADLERLEAEIRKRDNVRLVIIDPVSSYLGKVDSHKNSDVRGVLEPLGEMASRLGVAVLCNNHFSKGGGGSAPEQQDHRECSFHGAGARGVHRHTGRGRRYPVAPDPFQDEYRPYQVWTGLPD